MRQKERISQARWNELDALIFSHEFEAKVWTLAVEDAAPYGYTPPKSDLAFDFSAVRIPLVNSSRCAIVSEKIAALVLPHKWRLNNWGYAVTEIRHDRIVSECHYIDEKEREWTFTRHHGKTVTMHGYITESTRWSYARNERLETDHINGIKIDNRFCNLRSVTPAKNKEHAEKLHEKLLESAEVAADYIAHEMIESRFYDLF